MDAQESVQILDRLQHELDAEQLAAFARSLHAADLASAMEAIDPDRRLIIFACLDNAAAADLLDELSPELQQSLLAVMPADHASDILEEMPPDEAADLLGDLPDADAHRILEAMDTQDAADVRGLLDYESDTAGGQMTTEFIAVSEGLTAEETIQQLRELAPEAETIYYLFVVNRDDRLVGVLSLRTLIVSDPASRVADIMNRDVISLSADADQEVAADLIARYNLMAVPVVDDAGRPIGIITVDDAVDVIDEEATEDVYELQGGDHPLGAGALLLKRLRRAAVVVAQSIFIGLILFSLVRLGPEFVTRSAWTIVAFLPVMLTLSWLFELHARASLMARMSTGRDRPEPLWMGFWSEMAASVFLGLLAALICSGVLLAPGVIRVVPASAVLPAGVAAPAGVALPVGVGLACGLFVSAAAAYLLPRLGLLFWPGRDRLPMTGTLAAHTAAVLAYLAAAITVSRF